MDLEWTSSAQGTSHRAATQAGVETTKWPREVWQPNSSSEPFWFALMAPLPKKIGIRRTLTLAQQDKFDKCRNVSWIDEERLLAAG